MSLSVWKMGAVSEIRHVKGLIQDLSQSELTTKNLDCHFNAEQGKILCCHLKCILGIISEWRSPGNALLCCHLVCMLRITSEWNSPGNAHLCSHLVCMLRITPVCMQSRKTILYCYLVGVLGIKPVWRRAESYFLQSSSVHLSNNTRV